MVLHCLLPSLLVLRCQIQYSVCMHTFTGAWAQTLPPQDVEHLSRACVALLTTTFELAKKESIPPALVVLQPAVTRIWYILPLSVKHANPPVSKH